MLEKFSKIYCKIIKEDLDGNLDGQSTGIVEVTTAVAHPGDDKIEDAEEQIKRIAEEYDVTIDPLWTDDWNSCLLIKGKLEDVKAVILYMYGDFEQVLDMTIDGNDVENEEMQKILSESKAKRKKGKEIISEGWGNSYYGGGYRGGNYYKKRTYSDNSKTYSLPDVAIATKRATGDFRGTWVKGGNSTRVVFEELRAMEKDGTQASEEGKQLILDAFEYWSKQSGDFAQQCAQALQSMDCPSDKVGVVAYAVLTAGKVGKFNKTISNGSEQNGEENADSEIAGSQFKFDERVELELKYEYEKESTYNYGRAHGFTSRWGWYNKDISTWHSIFTSEKYPDIYFDVVFSKADKKGEEVIKELGRNLIKGDVVKVSGKVKRIDPKDMTISLNYGKLLEIISKAAEPEE